MEKSFLQNYEHHRTKVCLKYMHNEWSIPWRVTGVYCLFWRYVIARLSNWSIKSWTAVSLWNVIQWHLKIKLLTWWVFHPTTFHKPQLSFSWVFLFLNDFYLFNADPLYNILRFFFRLPSIVKMSFAIGSHLPGSVREH